MAASTSLTNRLGRALCDTDAAAELVSDLNGAVPVGSISQALRRRLISGFEAAGEEVIAQLLTGSMVTPSTELNRLAASALNPILATEFLTLLVAI
jgi:hypothetical protein